MNLRSRLVPCLALLWLVFCPSPADARQPNLIVIMADDLGYADLSCYGGRRHETPHLDALARQGLRFTDYHANGPVCSPTRAALLTGRYQQRAGVDEVVYADPDRGLRETHGLQPTEVTFAKLLRAAGYRTALFGKWHLGYARRFNPVHHGFDEFRGYVSGNVDYHSHFDQAGFFDWWQNLETRDEPGYSTHLITRHAVRFVEENRGRPFCLYVAHEAPHAPYQGPADPPVRGPDRQPPLSKPADIRRAYREMVREMDEGVGALIATLRRLGLDRDTFVFFCSDNGATRTGDNGPLHGFKGSVWEGGHRVPAIVWWPGKIESGTTAQTALAMDLLPTLIDLAGIPAPEGHRLDGLSLAPLLLEGKDLSERTLFWGYNNRYAVRQGPWKLVVNQPEDAAKEAKGKRKEAVAPVALFHLGDDPGEDRDLASRHPAKVAELRGALDAWKQDVTAGTTKQP